MILAAVVCPHPPLLLRELCGREDAVPQLRAACHEALGEALATTPDVVLVVGGDEEGRSWDGTLPVDVGSFGTTGASRVTGLPQSLGVGKRLLEDVGWDGPTEFRTVDRAAAPSEVAGLARELAADPRAAVLLVLGDGSTRRGDGAPGYLDERAFGFDSGVAAALEKADAAALATLDAGLAEELMVHGRAAFALLGEVVIRQLASPQAAARAPMRPSARLLYCDDPFGVAYNVAVWHLT